MAIFKGAGVAIATPMKENLEVNYDKLDEMLEEQIAGGTDAIIICGTTGESATMTEEEHAATIRFAIERVNHRIPVIAGTGSNCTRTAIQLSKEAQEDGADGLLLVTPYYNKATQNGLIAHYTAICNEVNIPAILYNVPSRTGCGLQPQTVATLVKDVENIVGIKEASGNISTVAQIMHLCDGNVDLYSGNDDQVVPLLALGGIGVISVLSNVAPTYVHDMCYKFFSGDIAGSRKMQLDALPLIDALFCEVNPIPVKAALNMMGKEVGTLRAPLTEMEDAHKEVLSAQQMIEALEQGQSYKIMSIFIRLGYDRLRQIEQEQRYFRGTIYTDYSEYPMKVVIKKNERYLEKIRDLYRIFEENHVRWKSICAPYIEKIYDVYVVETECPDDDEILRIDVDFEELSDVILYDYIPMWNIYTGNERTGIYPELSVDRVNYDHLIYASRFQKGKDYLIDSRETKVWNVYRTDADMRIICDSAEPISWDVLEFSYEPYEREMDMPVFGNRDSSEIRDAEIHTMAEVKRFIHALGYDNLLKLKDIKVMKIKRQDIYKTTYSMDAFMEDELRNGFTRQVLRLVFQRVAEPGYLDWDIMSYIISRIQWKLPEFNCIGEFE